MEENQTIEDRVSNYINVRKSKIESTERVFNRFDRRSKKLERRIKEKRAALENNFRTTKSKNESKIWKAKRLQYYFKMMKLNDIENRHAIRILEGKDNSHKNYDYCYHKYPCININNVHSKRAIAPIFCSYPSIESGLPTYQLEYLSIGHEEVLAEDEVYKKIGSLIEKIESFNEIDHQPPISLNNRNNFLGDGHEGISVESTLLNICKFYQAAMESRTMKEQEYVGFENGTHPLSNLVKKMRTYLKRYSNKVKKLDTGGRAELYFKEQSKPYQKCIDNFMNYFTEINGDSPYQKLKEMRDKIEPLTHYCLQRRHDKFE